MKKEIRNQKVYLKSCGCQMNVRDSEVIVGLLTRDGYQLATNETEADIIIYNTCSVRQHAEDKVWSELGKFKKKGQSPSGTVPIIGVVGCTAQNYKDEIFRRTPQVDFVVGPSDIHKIPIIIKKLATRYSLLATRDLFDLKIWETDGELRPEEIYHTGFYKDKEHAYVVISEGCSNHCSYCIVPYVRGPLRNRNYKYILREIEEALDKGISKITLLGQNVCAYGADYREQITENRLQRTEDREKISFVKLLELVNQIKGIREFSFITSHPKDTTIDLFKIMQDCEKLKKYLHLPVQSGSDRILKIMNRGYSRQFYLDLVQNYRRIVKNGVLTTDIIVGFPTETEENFQDTYNLVKNVEFNAAYIFKYSTRPNTAAAKLVDEVEKKEKERRHRLILQLQKNISKKNKC